MRHLRRTIMTKKIFCWLYCWDNDLRSITRGHVLLVSMRNNGYYSWASSPASSFPLNTMKSKDLRISRAFGVRQLADSGQDSGRPCRLGLQPLLLYLCPSTRFVYRGSICWLLFLFCFFFQCLTFSASECRTFSSLANCAILPGAAQKARHVHANYVWNKHQICRYIFGNALLFWICSPEPHRKTNHVHVKYFWHKVSLLLHLLRGETDDVVWGR